MLAVVPERRSPERMQVAAPNPTAAGSNP